MPYLKVYLPETPVSVKRTLATELTDTILSALNLPREHRMQTTVNFSLRAAGRTDDGARAANYHVELHHLELPKHIQHKVQHALTQCLCRALGLTDEECVTLGFHTFNPFESVMRSAAVAPAATYRAAA